MITQPHKKKTCQNPVTRPYIPYVFEVADSESAVHLTPSPQGQGQVKVKFTKLTATQGLTVYIYVFDVADSESVVHLTPSPQGQGQVRSNLQN